MKRLSLCLAAVFLPAVATAAVQANPLLLVPDDALGAVVVNQLGETGAELARVVGQMGLPSLNPIAHLKLKAGIRKGLQDQGAALLLILEDPRDTAQPAVLLALPAMDSRQLITEMAPKAASGDRAMVRLWEGEFLARALGSYVVIAEPRHQALLDKMALRATPPATLAPLAEWAGQQTAAVLVMPRGVRFLVREIQRSMEDAEMVLTALEGEIPGAGDAIKPLAALGKSVRDEAEMVALGAKLQAGELRMTARLLVTAGRPLSAALATVTPPKVPPLSAVPGGPFAIAAGGVFPRVLREAAQPGWLGMLNLSKKLTQAQLDQLATDSKELLRGVEQVWLMLDAGKARSSLYAHLLTGVVADDSAEFLKRYSRAVDHYNAIVKASPLSLPALEAKPAKVDRHAGLEISLETAKLLADAPGMETIVEKLFGQGGRLKSYLVATDRQHVLAGYTDADLLRQALSATAKQSPRLIDQPEVKITLAVLPREAPWVALVSPRGVVQFLRNALTLFGLNDAADQPREFPTTPPIGVAAMATSSELTATLVVPAITLKELGRYGAGANAPR